MQMKTPKHGPRPRRRWASLFVVAIAWLIASTSARAGDDGHDWSLKAQTDEGIWQVWQAQGVPSEEGFFRAWFATFWNPNVKPGVDAVGAHLRRVPVDVRAAQSQGVSRCAHPRRARVDRKPVVRVRDHAHRRFRADVFRRGARGAARLRRPALSAGRLSDRADDTLNLTILWSALHESPPQQLLDRMHAWRTGTPAGVTDLLTLYIADTYPALLGFDKKETIAKMPAYRLAARAHRPEDDAVVRLRPPGRGQAGATSCPGISSG